MGSVGHSFTTENKTDLIDFSYANILHALELSSYDINWTHSNF